MLTRALHAAAELLQAILLAVDQGDELEDLVDARAELGPREAVHLAPEQQVLASAHVRVKRDVLRDDADGLLDGLRVGDHGVTVHERVAAAGVQQAREHGDGGALAGPVRAEEAEDLALGDVEAHAVDGQHALGRIVPFAQVLDIDDAHRPTLPVRRAADDSLYTEGRAAVTRAYLRLAWLPLWGCAAARGVPS